MFQIKYLGSTINIEKNSCITITGTTVEIKEIVKFIDEKSPELDLADAIGELIFKDSPKPKSKTNPNSKTQRCIKAAMEFMSTRPLHVASDVLYHIEQTERISKRESLQILYGNKDIKKMNGIWGLKNCYG